mmetsp:Transcript_31764/g.92801  ORF Transcript_31764/g.92801 Transcript_31764/m.92801 type:complete len:227 (+) Transcript_31764:143-823(+)
MAAGGGELLGRKRINSDFLHFSTAVPAAPGHLAAAFGDLHISSDAALDEDRGRLRPEEAGALLGRVDGVLLADAPPEGAQSSRLRPAGPGGAVDPVVMAEHGVHLGQGRLHTKAGRRRVHVRPALADNRVQQLRKIRVLSDVEAFPEDSLLPLLRCEAPVAERQQPVLQQIRQHSETPPVDFVAVRHPVMDGVGHVSNRARTMLVRAVSAVPARAVENRRAVIDQG